MHRVEAAEVVERLWEERVRVPMVERDVGGRAQDDQHALAVDPQAVKHL